MAPPAPEIIKARRESYPKGRRVRAVRFATDNSFIDDNITVPPGTEGSVVSIDDWGTIFVRWDNGSRLGVLLEDRIEVT